MNININDTITISGNGTRKYSVISEEGNKIQLRPEYNKRKIITIEVESGEQEQEAATETKVDKKKDTKKKSSL